MRAFRSILRLCHVIPAIGVIEGQLQGQMSEFGFGVNDDELYLPHNAGT